MKKQLAFIILLLVSLSGFDSQAQVISSGYMMKKEWCSEFSYQKRCRPADAICNVSDQTSCDSPILT
jgi:hypothetical protein